MQPFKMLVGDMVNEKQKARAYAIQSFLCNAGSVVGYIFPFLFTFLGIKNVADKGVVPDSVIWSFYIGAVILILCAIYTTMNVKEWNPQEYAEYNGQSEELKQDTTEDKGDWLSAPQGSLDILEGGSGAVFQLGRVPISLELFHRCHRRDRLEHYRPRLRTVSGSRQLGGHTLCRTGNRQCGVGRGAPDVQEYQGCLFRQSGNRRCGFRPDTVSARPVSADYPVLDDRCGLGGHVGHAIHFCYQRLAGLRTHGGLSGSVQRNNLHTADCGGRMWRQRPWHCRLPSEQHDDCGRYTDGLRFVGSGQYKE